MRIAAATLIALCVLSPACSRHDQEQAKADARKVEREVDTGLHKAGQEIKQAVKTSPSSESARPARREYEDQMQARLDKIDREIDILKERASHAEGRHKADLERRIADLQQTRDETRSKYRDLKSAHDGAWDTLKGGLDKAVDKLQDGFEKLKRDLHS